MDKTSADTSSARSDYKKKAFDTELRALIKQGQETIITRYGADGAKDRVEMVCINRYLKIFGDMDPQEHFAYFETLFNRNRNDVLNTLSNDKWLRSHAVIQFGEGTKFSPELMAKMKSVRIMLSDIYLIACDLQKQAESLLDGIDEKYHSAGGKDLIRPNILQLHLMRIFYHLTDGRDKDALGKMVTQIEEDLGITHKTVGSEPWKAAETSTSTTTDQPATGAQPTKGALSGLFEMATNMMKQMGYQQAANLKPPSEEDINNVMGTVFNNPTTQNAIKGMMESLNGQQDFNSVIQTVVKNISDPTTLNSIQESVTQTAQLAQLSPEQRAQQIAQSVQVPAGLPPQLAQALVPQTLQPILVPEITQPPQPPQTQ